MKKNIYPSVAVCGLLCFFLIPALANHSSSYPSPFQTVSTSFVSKPANNSVGNAAPYLKVTANVVTGASRYTIELNTSPDFTGESLVRTSTKDYERTLLFTGLAYSKTYYARVKADVSSYGKVTRFQTRAEMFSVVVVPANGSDEQHPEVLKINVAAIPDARRYWLELSTTPDFSDATIPVDAVEDYQRSFIVRNLQHATTYYARVRTDINTAFGPVTSFTMRQLIPQKRLWGLTTTGGGHEFGTVFSFSVDSSTFSKHHDYLENSEYPYAYAHGTLVPAPDGGFYGNSECANMGTCGNGEVFYISPEGAYELKSAPGIHAGNLMLASNNHLYVLHDWINTFRGGIIKLNADSTGFDLSQVVYKFSSRSNGLNPKAALLELNNGYLYGIAPYGGNTGHGVIYRIKHNGTGFQVLYHFTLNTTGGYPQGALVQGADGYLYGTTSSGGTTGYGTVFKIFIDGTGFTKLHDFTGSSGKNPHCTLTHLDGVLYGTTRFGGDNNFGVVFKLNIDGTGYQKVYNFSGVTGSEPFESPTADPAGYLYGMTSRGGASDMGVIYKLSTSGAMYSKLFDFKQETGGMPDGRLTLVEDLFPASGTAFAASAKQDEKPQHSYRVGLFPNPFDSGFTADIRSDDDSAVEVVISDMHGQVMSRAGGRTNATLQLGDRLERGMYILKVIKNGEVSQYRIVKR